jgi:hypothetical protein
MSETHSQNNVILHLVLLMQLKTRALAHALKKRI